jgi:hypothetical protein
MTVVMAQVVGLVGAVAVYGTALVGVSWAGRARIRRLPVDWNERRELRDFYEQGPSFEMLRALRTRWRWLLVCVAPVAVASCLYAVVGTSIAVELGVCAVGGCWLAGGSAETLDRASAGLPAKLGLSRETIDAALRPTYLTWSFIGAAGLVGIGCFLGGLIGTLV